MKNSKAQGFWVSYGLVMVILLGAGGFYLYRSLGAYKNTRSDFQMQVAKKNKLEAEAIYPNKENLSDLVAQLDEFEGNVNVLHESLKAFQKPLERVTDQDFPQILRGMIEQFKAYTGSRQVAIPSDFYYGMNEYETSLPTPQATGILKYQLDAIDYLLRKVVDNEGSQIIALDRERVAVETPGGVNPELTRRVVKYPIKVSFQTTHDGLRQFLNQVSNDETYFFIVRVLRVDNEEKTGPPTNVESRIPEELNEEDARVIFGDEELRVTALIDLCRFPEITDGTAASAEDLKKS